MPRASNKLTAAEREWRVETFLPTGKLPSDLLQRLLERYVHPLAKLPLGAGLGRDAAVIEFDGKLLIAKTDPITFLAEDLGYYAVHVNVNDVACMGGEPKWFLSTILLPESKTRASAVEDIFQQIGETCESMGVAWCGGHTEITAGIAQPIVVGCLLAEAPLARRFSPNLIQPEDRIILTKGLAVEATSILGRVQKGALAQSFETEFAQKCRQFLFEPGISVYPEARLAWEIAGIHALHDVTEGGLANAIHEVLEEKQLGVEIEWPFVPIFPETKVLCEYFGLDPLGIIASGALLIIGEERACVEILLRLRAADINAAEIGVILPPGEKRWLLDRTDRIQLPRFHSDEIVQIIALSK